LGIFTKSLPGNYNNAKMLSGYMENKTALIVFAIMAVLSIAAVATVVNTAMALRGPPANRGTETAGCASNAHGSGAQNCAITGP
jgi:ABC-type xylose transport system permease subunit